MRWASGYAPTVAEPTGAGLVGEVAAVPNEGEDAGEGEIGFVGQYLDVFNRGFHYAFIAAVVMICVSMVIFLLNQKKFPDPSKKGSCN